MLSLSHRRSRADHRRRPQPGACRADPAQARRRPPPARLRAFYRFFGERRRRAEHRAPIERYHRAASRCRDARLLGRARLARPPAHRALRRAISTATACSAASSASATVWPGCMASTRATWSGRATLAEQRAFFDAELAPLFDKRLVRWLTAPPASLFGLGIPPAQYEELRRPARATWPRVLRARLERLACGFPLQRQLFRLAGLRPPLRRRTARPAAALSAARTNFARIRERGRAGRGAAHLHDRALAAMPPAASTR